MKINNCRLLFIAIQFTISFCFISCRNKPGTDAAPISEIQTGVLQFEIDPGTTYQIIDNFGASDAWSCQFVGQWPLAKKEKIADLLFSKQMDPNGNPEGIGLSLWRFNLGAGSARQGMASGIKDEWRRTGSFLREDGTYDWNRQKGQVWFARAAKERDVENFLIFSNSPPVSLTRNGKAYADNGNRSNLSPENYNEFARYLARATEGLGNMGLTVDVISPVNEPQWDWDEGGQEGTSFRNNEIAAITRLLDKELEKRGLNTKIDIAEAGQINYLYETAGKAQRGAQIEAFFRKSSENYVGDLSHLGRVISGHSYFTTSPRSELVRQREELAKTLKKYPGLKYWMSEYCILGDNNNEIKGNDRDLGIGPALYLARVIHHDLVVANASAWHWWLAVSPYDYKDGLIYIDKNKADGNICESKMLWALGNYSRFIRPGFQRVKVMKTSAGNTGDLLVSGYRDVENKELILVAINSGQEDVKVNFIPTEKFPGPVRSYVTSAGKNLEHADIRKGKELVIPGSSIVTLVYNN
ncbi:xylanase [Sinomicrobium pectinilyticum]|uniref:Xylanase n=1 Tax=Sinomicrobium pectinilyticum TaxID=1084421 RepID=A0A3N0EIX2_SINP1|nr:glycoside hydrolase [Sinomicrobium pectinilyticum]RNL87845.1 xylanase [Sinomicrobium pectinilyticum]